MRFLVARGRGYIGIVLVPLPRAAGHQVGGTDVAWAAMVAPKSMGLTLRAVALLRLAAYPYGPESM
jgi:hypothetical protein